MPYLLDTHVFLWLMYDVACIPPDVRDQLADETNELYMSSISIWEIYQKYTRGKLSLKTAPDLMIPKACHDYRIASLGFESSTCRFLPQLPALHKDPFDRMLICQAIEHGLTIVTNDRLIRQYPIRTLW